MTADPGDEEEEAGEEGAAYTAVVSRCFLILEEGE